MKKILSVVVLVIAVLANFNIQVADASNVSIADLEKEASKNLNSWWEDGKIETAIEQYSTLIAENPEKAADYYSGRAEAYINLKKYDETVADYTKAIELSQNKNPEHAAYYYSRRGSAYGGLEKYDETLADYTKAIELNPNDFLYYVYRAEAYEKLEKYDEAIADYTKCIEVDHGSSRAYSVSALAYGRLGMYDEEIANYTNVLNLLQIILNIMRIAQMLMKNWRNMMRQ